MKIFAVDDEHTALNILERAITEAAPGAEVSCFQAASAVLARLGKESPPDVIFLDIEIPGMGGLELARRIRELSPKTNVIFVTGFSQYAMEAFSLWPSGYVIKPATKEKIQTELQNLRYPIEQEIPCRIRIQCFGDFEIFVDGKPLRFERSKTKELLAYLVDRRGAAVNTAKLCAVLWEDAEDTEMLRKKLRYLTADLAHKLHEADADEVFLKERNSFAVAPDTFECDYYDYLNNKPSSINTYHGEYMSQFSWSELTLVSLEN